MAITKSHPGINVSVTSQGKLLPEYDNDEEETSPQTITKYIEAQSGAEFAIQIELQKPFPVHSVKFRLYLDGRSVCSRIVSEAQYAKAKSRVKRTIGSVTSIVAEGRCMIQKFCFSDLSIDDSHDQPVGDRLIDDLKTMGEITLKAYYIDGLKDVLSKPSGSESSKKKILDAGVIPEKALKGRALSHQAGLSAPVNMPYSASGHHTDFKYVDPNKQPFAVVTFKYRSKEALRSLLVIPRSPSPVPLEDRDTSTLTLDESRELLRPKSERDEVTRGIKEEVVQQKSNADKLGTIKRAAEDDDEISFVSSKRRQPRTTFNKHGIETIDLT
ncbi:uncharacterized protein K460DRAFT_372171 [Cucurbitaria berberidis CBS 394.84]|uniref:DUF7918 domain-containing protein n=1 Tax=Cucurbitaria berberidis CBS 394.84 TaxID=1168544 RepID=A0A9P4GQL3_9PLEO|nr:uncharacterized protein K460DRAFT_372171 [Cucurbitaria berberidis CBS 394.84]KAF1849734.1 hypothetical protein K460DRAFT_372171 [Cucurbitaria berberidis CBS 394.84]